jgi:DNA end-binding protein Ku
LPTIAAMATAKKTRKRATKKAAKKTAKKSARKNGARAMWKGVISFGSVELPVKLYSAVQDRDVHFRLLHRTDKQPVKQVMINPETDEEVPSERIRKAYDDGDVLVLLDDEELEAIKPKPSREIEITRFVDPEDVTWQWYDRPYYLGPDGTAGQYFAMADALTSQNKHGIARWVMRNKEYVGAVVPEDDRLMLITLRHADEIIPISALEPPAGRIPDAKEVKLAEQLISTLESDFDPGEFKDEFRERVLEFIEKKAKGRAPKLRKLPAQRPSEKSLADVLAASLNAMDKERKSA